MSIKAFVTFAVAVSLTGLMVACSPGGQQSPVITAPADGASVPAGAEKASALTVRPATVDGCKAGQPIIATVSWHSSAPHVKVMVGEKGSQKLFSEGGYTGSAETGKWVVAKTRFTLVDSDSRKILASHVMGEVPCDSTPKPRQ